MRRIPRIRCTSMMSVLSLGAKEPVRASDAHRTSHAPIRHTFIAVALSTMLAAPASARAPRAPDAAMLKPIREWIAAYNAGTAPLPEEIFTQDVVITDEFAPFTWIGISGEHRWAKAIDSFIKPGQQHASAGAARRFQSTKRGDRVSFVLPATLTISSNRRKFTERALWFYVLMKTPNGWKIATDTWTPIGRQKNITHRRDLQAASGEVIAAGPVP